MSKTKKYLTSVDMFNNKRTTIFSLDGVTLGTIELIGNGTYNVEPVGKKHIPIVGIDTAISYLIKLQTRETEVIKTVSNSQQGSFFF